MCFPGGLGPKLPKREREFTPKGLDFPLQEPVVFYLFFSLVFIVVVVVVLLFIVIILILCHIAASLWVLLY